MTTELEKGVEKFAVVVDGLPKPLLVKPDSDGNFDSSALEADEIAGIPMVRIGLWLVSRDRIVAVAPESLLKYKAQFA